MEGSEDVTENVADLPLLGDQNLRQRKLMSCAKETFDNASRMLRREIPFTGHLMTPRRLWIKTIPTQECDVVLMFPPGTQDFTLMWLLSRLRDGTPGLVVHVRHHVSSDCYGFYLTAPFNVLLKASEELHLPKTLKPEFGGGLKEFVQQEESCFEGIKDEETFFTSQERQWLVLHLLQTLRAGPADEIGGLKMIEGQAIVPKCVAAGVISQVFPLHDPPALEYLQKSWVQNFFHKQPIDSVCGYFGVKIAMYFAWLGHYTTALIVPAVVGFIFWIGFCGRSQATEDVGYVLFSFFNVLWASVYVEAWKRHSAELAYRWGTLDQRDELLVEPRPLFTGTLEVSPVTGRLETTYPAWKRHVFRYLVSVPVISLCLAVVFFVMICFLQLQDWWDSKIADRSYIFCLSYLPKILLAVVITLMDEAYYKVALWLNDQENYRLETKYENHLIVKVALFQFVNSFLSLFYIAFYLQDQEKLKEQLAALLIARQVIGNLKESALPYMLEQFRLAKLSFDLFGALSPSDAKKPLPGEAEAAGEAGGGEKATPEKPSVDRNISQAELESCLYKYDGTSADHLEIFIQLGYVVLFSSAFPMAALCALVNNLVEMRSDAFKLAFIFQRPFGQRVTNIGAWQHAVEVMGVMAVLVNCALIGLSGQVHRMFPEMSTTQTILLIVALEHIMLTLRFVISCTIPSLPEWVATEMAKIEFARREACRRLSSTCTASAAPPDVGATVLPGLSIGRFVVSPTSEMKGEDVERDLKSASKKSSPMSEVMPPSPAKEKSRPASEETLLAVEESTSYSTSGLPSPGLPKPLSKRTRDFLGPEGVESYHLTIGPHGVDWVKRMEVQRKSSEPQIGSASGDELPLHRSTDCIVTPKELSASSDSDLLRSAPPWAQPQARQKFRFSPEKEPSPSDSSRTLSSQEEEAKSEEWATKKTRVKQSLVKRARSVAIFSLKLKERRAREAAKEADKKVEAEKKAEAKKVETKKWGTTPQNVGGELSCIPIEKLISVDDVALDLQRRKNNHH